MAGLFSLLGLAFALAFGNEFGGIDISLHIGSQFEYATICVERRTCTKESYASDAVAVTGVATL